MKRQGNVNGTRGHGLGGLLAPWNGRRYTQRVGTLPARLDHTETCMTWRSVFAWLPLVGAMLFAAPAWAQDDTDVPVDEAPVTDTAAPDEAEAEDPSALDGGYVRDLLAVEGSVHGLKEDVFRTKATLQLLRELVMEGATLGSGVSIWHVNDLAKAYELESIQYFLDGKSIWVWTSTDGDKAPRETEIRDQSVTPGNHTLQVNMTLRGAGLPYLRKYRFTVESNYAFEVVEGRLTTLEVRAVTRGGASRAFVDRPTILYEARSEQIVAEE